MILQKADLLTYLDIIKRFNGGKSMMIKVEDSVLTIAARTETGDTAIVQTNVDQEDTAVMLNGSTFIDIVGSLPEDTVLINFVDQQVVISTGSGQRTIPVATAEMLDISDLNGTTIYRGSSYLGEEAKRLGHVKSHLANRASMSAIISSDMIATFNTSEIAICEDNPFEDNEIEEPFIIPDFNRDMLWVFKLFSESYEMLTAPGRTIFKTVGDWNLTLDLVNMSIPVPQNMISAIVQRLNGYNDSDAPALTVNRSELLKAVDRVCLIQPKSADDKSINFINAGQLVAFWTNGSERVVEHIEVSTDSESHIAFSVPAHIIRESLRAVDYEVMDISPIYVDGRITSIAVGGEGYVNIIAVYRRIHLPTQIRDQVNVEDLTSQGYQVDFR